MSTASTNTGNSLVRDICVLGQSLSSTLPQWPVRVQLQQIKVVQRNIFRESFQEEVEDFEQYRPGGFHPVHIGDIFQNGRYTVLNKLGAGSFATVWFVEDKIDDTFRALKILTAGESRTSREVRTTQILIDKGGRPEVLLLPTDSFKHEGPNGRHTCIVTDVAGPNTAAYLESL